MPFKSFQSMKKSPYIGDGKIQPRIWNPFNVNISLYTHIKHPDVFWVDFPIHSGNKKKELVWPTSKEVAFYQSTLPATKKKNENGCFPTANPVEKPLRIKIRGFFQSELVKASQVLVGVKQLSRLSPSD